MPRIRISYCETKSLNITKIGRNAMKKKRTTGAISRIRPNSPSVMDMGRVQSCFRRARLITETYGFLGVSESLAISSARIGTPILHA